MVSATNPHVLKRARSEIEVKALAAPSLPCAHRYVPFVPSLPTLSCARAHRCVHSVHTSPSSMGHKLSSMCGSSSAAA